MNSFRAVIELWDSREAMAADLGVKSQRVSKWWQRNSIPSEWWARVLAAEPARGAGVTAEMLTSFAAPRCEDAEAAE
jgi:hypothetical protein